MNNRISCSLLMIACAAATSPLDANTVGYWRLEEGPLDADSVTLISEVNSPSMDGSRPGIFDPLDLLYTDDVPGTMIADPVAGTNVANRFSLDSVGQFSPERRFEVVDPLTNPESFTFEIFVKNENDPVPPPDVIFQNIANKERVDGLFSWALFATNDDDAERDGTVYLRVDSNGLFTPGGSAGFNENIVGTDPEHDLHDGLWHHVAVTYDGPNSVFELFYDYESVGTLQPSGPTGGIVSSDTGTLHIGGRTSGSGWSGLFDEPRLSDTVLTPSQFLTASGGTGSGADVDGDGDVDGNDFLIIQRTDPTLIPLWQSEYGSVSESAGIGAPVPEPTSLALLATLTTLVCFRMKKQNF